MMLDRREPRQGGVFLLRPRPATLLLEVALVCTASTAQAVNNGPQAYYFNAVGAFTEGTANGAWWHYETGATITGVFIYDNRANPTTTEPIPDAGYVPVFP